MKRLLFNNEVSGVSIVIPSPKESIEEVLGPLTIVEYEAHVIEKSIPDGVQWRFLEDIDVPQSREFRGAWEDTQIGGQIDINCEKARDIKLEKVREDRKPILEEQDKLSIMAIENSSDLTVIKAEKQRLRDLTNPLKALDVIGKYNDGLLLQEIIDLSSFDKSKKFDGILNP